MRGVILAAVAASLFVSQAQSQQRNCLAIAGGDIRSPAFAQCAQEDHYRELQERAKRSAYPMTAGRCGRFRTRSFLRNAVRPWFATTCRMAGEQLSDERLKPNANNYSDDGPPFERGHAVMVICGANVHTDAGTVLINFTVAPMEPARCRWPTADGRYMVNIYNSVVRED